MDLDLKDKVVLVTGSGQGIGRTIALALAAEGALVAVNDVNVKGIEETVDAVRRSGHKAIAAPCDITSLDAVKEMVNKVQAELGRVDVLVNNAALLICHEMFLDTNPEDCDKEIRVILYGTMNCVRAVLQASPASCPLLPLPPPWALLRATLRGRRGKSAAIRDRR